MRVRRTAGRIRSLPCTWQLGGLHGGSQTWETCLSMRRHLPAATRLSGTWADGQGDGSIIQVPSSRAFSASGSLQSIFSRGTFSLQTGPAQSPQGITLKSVFNAQLGSAARAWPTDHKMEICPSVHCLGVSREYFLLLGQPHCMQWRYTQVYTVSVYPLNMFSF